MECFHGQTRTEVIYFNVLALKSWQERTTFGFTDNIHWWKFNINNTNKNKNNNYDDDEWWWLIYLQGYIIPYIKGGPLEIDKKPGPSSHLQESLYSWFSYKQWAKVA